MFKSFFPYPKVFFSASIIWILINMRYWYGFGDDLPLIIIQFFSEKTAINIDFQSFNNAFTADLPISVTRFWHPRFLWFYIWFWTSSFVFYILCQSFIAHKWAKWSILGSTLILFNIWFSAQVSVAINAWYNPFWDLIQNMLSDKPSFHINDLYHQLMIFLLIAMLAVTVTIFNLFFVSHYIFRWRTAMNDYYIASWSKLRHIEGASQRIQEDTMRFASTLESLGVELIKSVILLLAFMPILIKLSEKIIILPIVGKINPITLPILGTTIQPSLLYAAITWAVLGTVFLALIGIKLPGLEFNNQKVEAAFRKELVYGEDNEHRAQPQTLVDLFSQVRKNYFRLYFHYIYFNLARVWYLQLDVIYSLFILAPSIATPGLLTLGLLTQIQNVFNTIRGSFQYLISAWPTIIELLSIKKRLHHFERMMKK